MIECILLIGGLGSRLKDLTKIVPKPFLPVDGIPFVERLMYFYHGLGVERFILAAGYNYSYVETFLKTKEWPFDLRLINEESQLGTGGAIMNAIKHCFTNQPLVANGDSFIRITQSDFKVLNSPSYDNNIICKEVKSEIGRYGNISFDNGILTRIDRSNLNAKSLINCGLYKIEKDFFESIAQNLKIPYSFESQILPIYIKQKNMGVIKVKGDFIDIGLKKDYEIAHKFF